MDHKRLTHPPGHPCYEDSCNICNLYICSVCGGAEGSLTSDCPGREMTEAEEQAVLKGKLDYTTPHGWF